MTGYPVAVKAETPTALGHLRIARLDHWVKNVFVLPGVVIALSLDPSQFTAGLLLTTVTGLLAVGLVASSNYTINEVLDAPFDQLHPVKSARPVPSGQVSIPVAYVQWVALAVAGVALGTTISTPFAAVLFVLWVMGGVYNIPPVRVKDVPYLDVLAEGFNNPLRLLAGWFIVAPAVAAPLSLLAGYWMVGCFFMATKRYAEIRFNLTGANAAQYRKSLGYYTQDRLLVSNMFYSSAAMLCFGVFIARYRIELVLAFPLVALVMAVYLRLAFQPESAAEAPEKLYRQRALMLSVAACTIVMLLLLWIDIPLVQRLLAPMTPSAVQGWP